MMGRSLNFYALPDRIEHDKSKRFCMGWEHEQTHEETMDAVHAAVNGGAAYGTFREESAATERAWKENAPYSWDRDEMKLGEGWCPWCAAFANEGLYGSPLLKASVGFCHSYSNPIWRSDWHFCRMYPGQDHTDIVNRFGSERMYRQVFDVDVDNMESSLESIGTAYCTADREARDDTERAIAFCRRWLGEPGTIVIYESEL